jgi:hypothetical protein
MYYESLIAGCIPIILNLNNSYLIFHKYNYVPILYTNDYSDINEITLKKIYSYYLNEKFIFYKLLLYGLTDEDYNDCINRTNNFMNFITQN